MVCGVLPASHRRGPAPSQHVQLAHSAERTAALLITTRASRAFCCFICTHVPRGLPSHDPPSPQASHRSPWLQALLPPCDVPLETYVPYSRWNWRTDPSWSTLSSFATGWVQCPKRAEGQDDRADWPTVTLMQSCTAMLPAAAIRYAHLQIKDTSGCGSTQALCVANAQGCKAGSDHSIRSSFMPGGLGGGLRIVARASPMTHWSHTSFRSTPAKTSC